MTAECRPSPGQDGDNEFHEVWWNSVAGGDAPKGKLQAQLHEVWQFMGDAWEPHWRRPGDAAEDTPAEVYEEGWRWVRRIELLDVEMRMDGTPP